MTRCCGVTVAAMFGPDPSTNATASAVVMCSNTIFSAGKSRSQAGKDAIDEHGLAIEHVDVGIGDLAMHEQRHADALHRLERRMEGPDVGDALRAVGGGMGGVELAGGEDARFEAAGNLRRIGMVGQIEGHQRGEPARLGQGVEDAAAIGLGGGDRRHRRHQIGHDDRAGELACRMAGDRLQHLAVAQMDVPVVGPADLDAGGCAHGLSFVLAAP